MKILALTSIRSEYDLMSSLFKKLENDDSIELCLLVGGAHNSPAFGLTVEDIREDGFKLLQVESLIDGDSPSSRLKSASVLLMSSIDLIKNFEPDLIMYAGDREDVLVGSMIAGYLSIPTIHFFGGDHAQDGHIDNPVRHATSKLSTFHFVSTNEHEKRLIAIGEPKCRIFNIGSVALDKFYEIESNDYILNSIAGKSIVRPCALFIFHPVEEEISIIREVVVDTVTCLIESGYHVFIGKPNSDLGNTEIRYAIDSLAHLENITVYGNLPRKAFVQLFKSCKLIIGNSSAGLLEAASIPIPCINVGSRQKGRLCADNVVFSDVGKLSIKKAINKVQSKEFLLRLKNVVNPYGKGNASEAAYNLIKSLNLHESIKKREDPLLNDE